MCNVSDAPMEQTKYVKGFKYELDPTKEQSIALNKIFGCTRKVYNEILGIVNAESQLFKAGLSDVKPDVSTSALVNLSTTLKRHPHLHFLNDISSIAIQQKAIDQATAFTNYAKHRANHPRFKRKGYDDSFRIVGEGSIHVSKEQGITVPRTTCGPIKILWSRDLPSAPSSYTITRTPTGRHFISFICEYIPDRKSGTNQTGIDLGIKDIAVTSDGDIIPNPRWYQLGQKKLRKLQRRLARKIKGSKNYHEARIRLAKWHSYISNKYRDYLHKLTSALVRDNQAISIEDLNVSGMVKNRHLSKNLIQSRFGLFRTLLMYKVLESTDTYLIIANRWYPSTQICSHCGTKSATRINLAMRTWQCGTCGAQHHRDINAAINLKSLIPKALSYRVPGKRIILTNALDQ